LWYVPGILLAVLSSAIAAPVEIAQKPLRIRPDAPATMITARIRGDQTIDYLVSGLKGQVLQVEFKPSNASAYFNVLPLGRDEALFTGSTYGNRFEGALPGSGTFAIRVYLMRNAARRNEIANYALSVKLSDAAAGAGLPFDRTLELQGIRFGISSPNRSAPGADNTLEIVPAGLEIDNTPVTRIIRGTVTGAEVGDINADGSPEIYVYVTAPGQRPRTMLVAFSANRGKSLSEIHLPPITDNKVAATGYRGHDELALVENALVQRYPLYRGERPTGRTRQLQYRLVPGEATWLLRLEKTIEY